MEIIGSRINDLCLKEDDTIVLSILSGAFMFTSDLLKTFMFNPILKFAKTSSYVGMQSSGKIATDFGLDFDAKGKTIILIEDIVDSGTTIEYLYNRLLDLQVNKIIIVSLLLKPEAYKKSINIDYAGFKISNDFVVGYGMDYDGVGRNLKEIYVLKKE